MNTTKTLAENVRERREAKGYTIRGLAEDIGVSEGYIRHIEKGRITDPTPKRLAALALALDTSVEELYLQRRDLPPDVKAALADIRTEDQVFALRTALYAITGKDYSHV